MKKIWIFFFMLFLSACQSGNPLEMFRFQTMMAPPYVTASWWRIEKVGEPLKIYIEGDGASFDVHGRPTSNPTPKSLFLREIAADDTAPNVAYLARPCQYLQTASCQVEDWSNGRFSEKIIASMEKSVQELMKKAKTTQVILIGYSGGAQVAGLITARHPIWVKQVVTIAGVLDHAAWTQYHQDNPLDKSLNLKDVKQTFMQVPQIHFVGAKDKVVPPVLVQNFIKDAYPVVVVPKATHDAGYKAVYHQIYEIR